MAVVEIPYKPRKWALGFHESLKRWSVLVLHRRAGKTTAVLNHHLRAALDDNWEERRIRYLLPDVTPSQMRDLLKRRVYWHVMPTYHQGKLTGAWDTLKEISRVVPGAKANESELLVTLPNGNKVQIIGGDKPDSLRGPALSGLSLDEYSQIPSNAFSEVLSKSLADHVGYAVFSGTIKGSDQLYATHEAGKASDDWFHLWQDVSQSLETEEGATIEALRRAMEDDRKLVLQGLMTQGEFDQEWFLSREAAIKGAFYGSELHTAREQGRIGVVPYDSALAVDTDWDLGIDAMAVWFSQSDRLGAIRLIDYYEDVGGGLPAAIKVVKSKHYIYGQHWAPHDIEVREISSGSTRLQAAAGMGINFEVTPKIAVADGITALQLTLSRCWIDEVKCKLGLEALLHYKRTWNQRLARFTEEPVHDWACFTPDTKVLTPYGMRQIMDLPKNGEVLTPCGWRQYEGPRVTRRNAQLVAVTLSDGSTVRCTPDHTWLTESGWRSAESLKPGLLIQSCSIRSASILTEGYIACGPKSDTLPRPVSDFIGMSGVRRLVQSLMDVISTIVTGIRVITAYPTLSVFQPAFTFQTSGTGVSLEEWSTSQPPLVMLLPHGMPRKLAERGIAGTPFALQAGRNGSARIDPASTVGPSFTGPSSERTGTHRNIAPRRARPLRIVSVRPLNERADTWCIHVPEVECFALASGAIVHNSHGADAARGLAVRYQAPRDKQRRQQEAAMPRSYTWS